MDPERRAKVVAICVQAAQSHLAAKAVSKIPPTMARDRCGDHGITTAKYHKPIHACQCLNTNACPRAKVDRDASAGAKGIWAEAGTKPRRISHTTTRARLGRSRFLA